MEGAVEAGVAPSWNAVPPAELDGLIVPLRPFWKSPIVSKV